MHSPEELDLVERSLRKQGHRWTSQRRRIAEVVFDTHEHFNAEELLAMCRGIDSRISRATVYRTIAVLEEAGFVEDSTPVTAASASSTCSATRTTTT